MISRFVTAVFLLVWICGWAAGEWLGLRLTVWMLPRMDERASGPIIAGVFLLLTIGWTIGGIAGIVDMLRSLAGRDELHLDEPTWDGDALPTRWRAIDEDGGRARIEARRFEGAGCLAIFTAVMLVVAWGFLSSQRGLAVAVTLTLTAAIVAWATGVRRAWIVGAGYLASRVSFAGLVHERAFDPDSLSITIRTDSDGDVHCALRARRRGRKKTLYRPMHDERTVVALGRFFAMKTGWPMENSQRSSVH